MIRHIGIGLTLSFFLMSCAATRDLEFDRMNQPVIVSKVRYPGDSKDSPRKEIKFFQAETVDDYTSGTFGLITNREGSNISIQAQRATRGISAAYLKIDQISFSLFQNVYDRNVIIAVKGSAQSLKESP